MVANVKQNIVDVANDANLVVVLQGYLAQGFIISQMINLAPFSNRIMIIYYNPATDI